jgi:hypothetical protein
MTPHHAAMLVTSLEKCRWCRGKRELGIELRNHPFRKPALLLDRIGNREQTAQVRAVTFRRSRRPHASADTLCTRTGRAREASADVADRWGKVSGQNPHMYAPGKSDIGNTTCEFTEQSRPTDSGGKGGKYR